MVRFLRFLSFARGAVPRGSPKSHMAFWGEEKCTLEVSNRRKKLFKRRLRTYRRAFRRRHRLAKYKIQLVFLAVSQRVRLYNLLPLHLFWHAEGALQMQSPLFWNIFSRRIALILHKAKKIKNDCHKTRLFGIYLYRKAFPPPGAPAKGGPQKKFLKNFKIFVTKRPGKGI